MSVGIVPVVDLYTKCYIIKFHSFVYSNISLLNTVHGSNLSTLVMHEALYCYISNYLCVMFFRFFLHASGIFTQGVGMTQTIHFTHYSVG